MGKNKNLLFCVLALLIGLSTIGSSSSADAQTSSGCTMKGNQVRTQLSQEECDALVPFFEANPGSFSNPYEQDPCVQHGIGCNDLGVVELDFDYGPGGAGVRTPITVLPDSLEKLDNLRYVTLWSAPIDSIPEGIIREPLQRLILRNVGVNKLPDTIGDVSTLKTLEWSPTYVNINENIGRLSGLERLVIRGRFESIPDSIGGLKSLKYLELAHGGSSDASVPATIANLTNLEWAEFYGFNSASFPDAFASLDKLEFLEFNQMENLTELPPSIGEAALLKQLILKYTGVTALPESIGNLAYLEELTVQMTPVESLPDSFANLTQLRKFDFLHTDIAELPNWIGNWRKLEYLGIEGSLVSEIPPTIGELKRLELARMESLYSLSELPVEMSKAKSLQFIYLDNSAVTAVPAEFGRIESLLGVTGVKEPSFLLEGCEAGPHDFVLFANGWPHVVTITDATGAVTKVELEYQQARGTVTLGEGPYRIEVTEMRGDGQTVNVLTQTTRCGSVCEREPGSSSDGVVVGTESDDDLVITQNAPVTVCGLGGNDTITVTAPQVSVVGGDGNDIITVTSPDSHVWGSDGNDTITAIGAVIARGGAGDDTITGGDEDDILYGGSGNDQIFGGAGRDQVRGGTGDDRIDGGADNDYRLTGNGGSDTITGGPGNDYILGGPRPDDLNGGEGDDIINGANGADILRGQNGADSLYAGKGNDTLDGGNDADVCYNFDGLYTTFASCEQEINTVSAE